MAGAEGAEARSSGVAEGRGVAPFNLRERKTRRSRRTALIHFHGDVTECYF